MFRELDLVADLDFVAAMIAHPDVMRFWPRTYSRDEAVDWIKRQQGRYQQYGYGYWLTLDRATGEPVGQIGVVPQTVDAEDEVGLGWIIHRPFWRRGYASEAGRACLAWAFEHTDADRVIALVRPDNMPSIGVAEKLGMKCDGRTHYHDFEHLIYASRR
jgi:RimJ/RimL family protein N-acetyltransferase